MSGHTLQDAPRIIVGMTSLPSRLPHIAPALESIRKQTRRPDLVVLSLPERSRREGTGYHVPQWLLHATGPGGIHLQRTAVDFGPGTKLLGCLQHLHPHDFLVLFDDDHIYRPWVIEHLISPLADGRTATSFYTYRHRGIEVGQGADGFAMTGRVARKCGSLVPLIMAHRALQLHDDYWISFAIQQAGIRLRNLAPLLPALGATLSYERNPSITTGLANLGGPLSRPRLTDEANTLLFLHANPTWRMRQRQFIAMLRETAGRGIRRLRRRRSAS